MYDSELAETCYECTGYGDDYYYDSELDDWVSACDKCWVTYYDKGYEDDDEW